MLLQGLWPDKCIYSLVHLITLWGIRDFTVQLSQIVPWAEPLSLRAQIFNQCKFNWCKKNSMQNESCKQRLPLKLITIIVAAGISFKFFNQCKMNKCEVNQCKINHAISSEADYNTVFSVAAGTRHTCYIWLWWIYFWWFFLLSCILQHLQQNQAAILSWSSSWIIDSFLTDWHPFCSKDTQNIGHCHQRLSFISLKDRSMLECSDLCAVQQVSKLLLMFIYVFTLWLCTAGKVSSTLIFHPILLFVIIGLLPELHDFA